MVVSKKKSGAEEKLSSKSWLCSQWCICAIFQLNMAFQCLHDIDMCYLFSQFTFYAVRQLFGNRVVCEYTNMLSWSCPLCSSWSVQQYLVSVLPDSDAVVIRPLSRGMFVRCLIGLSPDFLFSLLSLLKKHLCIPVNKQECFNCMW